MKPNNRRIPRLFLDMSLEHKTLRIEPRHAHYLRRVLRLTPGDHVIVFNGEGIEANAVIVSLARDNPTVRIDSSVKPLAESPLELTLVQSLVKSEAMDLIIQKATELGVRAILPVTTEFSVVKLDAARASRRVAHWQSIARSACEQSGRHKPPTISLPQPLAVTLGSLSDRHAKLVLRHDAPQAVDDVEVTAVTPIKLALLIGPEGGLSDSDLESAARAGFDPVRLGPRILRTETAALTACALVQSRWGDLSV